LVYTFFILSSFNLSQAFATTWLDQDRIVSMTWVCRGATLIFPSVFLAIGLG